ncbi:MAG: acyltransferase family protein, partial [Methylocystis sp.]|nr:acyltransferase family protein [Methylocystis sp.]
MAFADLLRGLAALVVVLGHFTILYLEGAPAVATLIMAEPIATVPFPAAVDAAYSVFNLAWIGVAVFFLISGFVILLSLDGAGS